jgi:outer membrane protein OmpA-like peptidoglycan-associated protein
MKKFVILACLFLFVLSCLGCEWSAKRKGTLIGAGSGAVIGGIIGDKAGNTALGAILGAAVGGAAGAYIGSYMDKQAAELDQDLAGAKVERVGEGIKITFDSGILFDVNKSTLTTTARGNVDKLSQILNKYPDTNILVEGHTDATGTDEYNQKLSEQRAAAVATYAKGAGVDAARFTTVGYGEKQPIADNATTEGKSANRRVEIAIFANDKLKDAAEKGLIKE